MLNLYLLHLPDVIFKNQAAGANKPRSDFVNDLTRTEFHKEFMHRYIK